MFDGFGTNFGTMFVQFCIGFHNIVELQFCIILYRFFVLSFVFKMNLVPCFQLFSHKSQNHKKKSVRKLFTLLGHVFKNVKHIFKICSYIQKSTQNPINALEITIHNTKHTKNTKVHFQKSNIFERFENLKKPKCVFCHISNFHNSQFIHFVSFVYFIYHLYRTSEPQKISVHISRIGLGT